ncbi:MAG TPA: hypothetical protein DCZ55_24650 [Cyanobacteria bacterium UBA11371]|nr:hypothetical protein [Cyanobacteria bacterium UBA11371]HBE30200.1 hypothetical protein [Cyanobacteria bacterium UBA11368]
MIMGNLKDMILLVMAFFFYRSCTQIFIMDDLPDIIYNPPLLAIAFPQYLRKKTWFLSKIVG